MGHERTALEAVGGDAAPLHCVRSRGPAARSRCAWGGAPGQSSAPPPVIDVQRDKDKTVYSIGARPKDEGKDDADKAWNMLDNAIIDARGAHGKRPDNNR